MPIKNVFLLIISLLLASCIEAEQLDRTYQKVSAYSFDDTLQNLDIAIAEHNYRIIHRSNIGQAIRDRGDSNHPLSTIISFCNISYAKEMMSINPDLINDMPCNIAVREQDDNVIISTQLMELTGSTQQRKFASKINNNLISIIEATIE